jgi:hypothetical protein
MGSDMVTTRNNLRIVTITDKDKITDDVFIVTDFEMIYDVLSEHFMQSIILRHDACE